LIEPQVGFPMIGIRAMACKTKVRQNGADISIE
jgi:hypothetical protein